MSCSEIQHELNPQSRTCFVVCLQPCQWPRILWDPIWEAELNWRYRMCVSLRIRRPTRGTEYRTQALAPTWLPTFRAPKPIWVQEKILSFSTLQLPRTQNYFLTQVSPLLSRCETFSACWWIYRWRWKEMETPTSFDFGNTIAEKWFWVSWRHMVALTETWLSSALGLSWEVSAAPYIKSIQIMKHGPN